VSGQTLHKCCKTPRNDVVAVNLKDKSCPGPNFKVFNNYFLNKQQDSKDSFKIKYDDVKVQKALGKDAVSSKI
jgi:hypothetical protein